MDWLLQSGREINEPPSYFLSPKEQAKYDSLRFWKRQSDWLIGRWTAKLLLRTVLEQQGHRSVTARAIEIFNGVDGAPRVYIDEEPLAMDLSISHSHGYALCALDSNRIGADLEWIEPRQDCLTNDFFTASEQAQVAAVPQAQRDTLVTAIWSAKEAGLKALHKGLTMDTRLIEIGIAMNEQGCEEWEPFEITGHLESQTHLNGWWRERDGFVQTVALTKYHPPSKFQHCLFTL